MTDVNGVARDARDEANRASLLECYVLERNLCYHSSYYLYALSSHTWKMV